MFSKKHNRFLTSVLYAAVWNPNVNENTPGVSGKPELSLHFSREAHEEAGIVTQNIYYSVPTYVQSVNHLSDPPPLFMN